MRLKRKVWEVTDALPPEVEQGLIRQLGEAEESSDDTRIWMEEESRGLHQCRVEYDTSANIITETICVQDWLKYLFVVFVPILVSSIVYILTLRQPLLDVFDPAAIAERYAWSVARGILVFAGFLSYSVLMFISSGPALSLDGGEWGVVRDRSANPYYWLAALLGYTLIGTIFSSVFTSSIWLKLCIPVFCTVAGVLYLWKPELFSSPFGSVPSAMSDVVLLGVAWMLLPVVFVWVFSFGIGNVTGSYAETTLDPLITRGLVFFITAVVTLSVSTTWWLCKASDESTQNLVNSYPEWFGSQIVRYAVLLLYLLLNIISVCAGVICFDLIYFGIVESSFLFDNFQGWLRMMYSSYQVLDTVFAGWPVFFARAYATMTYALLLAPTLFFIGMWVYSTATHVIARSRLFFKLNTSETLESDVVPETVDVVVSESGLPNAHSGSLFFGWRDFIVVSQPLIDALTDEELDAVLAHEMYHLRNQDWITNLLASIFAVMAGGQNSLLVFYDYPRIEREADDYAVQEVGRRPLSDALKQLEIELLKLRRGSDEPAQNQLPGVSELLSGTRYWDSEQISQMREYLTAPYRLFFSPLLMDASHLSPEERRERIAD